MKGEIGDCVNGSSITGVDLEEAERGGIGGGGPLPSLSLGAGLKVPNELVLDLPNDD